MMRYARQMMRSTYIFVYLEVKVCNTYFFVNYPSNNVSQASLVKQTLVADSALADLQVATVDAYEGTEKDIIIL